MEAKEGLRRDLLPSAEPLIDAASSDEYAAHVCPILHKILVTAEGLSLGASAALQKSSVSRHTLEETLYHAAHILRDVKDVQDRTRGMFPPILYSPALPSSARYVSDRTAYTDTRSPVPPSVTRPMVAASLQSPRTKTHKVKADLDAPRHRARTQLTCMGCGTQDTPEWRRGPEGAHTLCNRCGLRYAKAKEKNTTFETSMPPS